MIRNAIRLVVLALIVSLAAAGCKSKKKAMEASNVKKTEQDEAALRKQQEEEARKKEAEEQARRDAEAKQQAELEKAAANAPTARLNEYFSAIASSSNVASANNSINEALTLFASPQTPVLIVISEYDGQKDYDRPTTIQEYLHYLKDQKKNMNTISNLKMDSSGKITEVELKKPL